MLALLGAAAIYYAFFSLSDANIAALVPEDMRYGVFYRSLDELREAYENPHARSDLDPARRRVGRPVNAPGLDGMAYHRPVGSFFNREGEEIHIVPFRDFDAFDEAFEKGQDNLHLRAPQKIAKGYLGLSRTGRLPSKGPDHRLVRRGLEFPISLVGYPDNATTLKNMLLSLLGPDVTSRTGGVPPLAKVALQMPTPAAQLIAEELENLIVGVTASRDLKAPVLVTMEGQPKSDGILARAGRHRGKLGLKQVMACLPVKTTMFAAAALDGTGWRAAGLPVDIGDAAIAIAVIDNRLRAGRFQLLVVAKPAGGTDILDRLDTLAPVLFAEELAANARYKDVRGTPVRVAKLTTKPPLLKTFLRSGTVKPLPVYFASAREGGLWFGAIGAYAEGTIQSALGCHRGASELSVLRSPLMKHHAELSQREGVAVALISPEGLRALKLPMPYFGIVSLDQPPAITAILDVEGQARMDVRITR